MGVISTSSRDAVARPVMARVPLVKATILGAVVLLLVLLVVQPFGWVLFNSLHDDATGAWTLNNYARVVQSADLIEPLVNSLVLAAATALIAVGIGVPLAWLVSRTDLPFRRSIRVLTLTAFVTPSFIGATGWILLAAPNSGWLNTAWRWLAGEGAGAPLNIYSMAGAVFVCGIYTVPYSFTMVSSALDEMAVELEDAATTLGCGVLRTMVSITIPLAAPAVIASFILSFIQGLTLFGVPAFLLTPTGIPVVTTKLAEFYQLFPPEIYLAAAYCMPLLLVTGALFWMRRRYLGRKQYVTISGKTRAGRQIHLGAWRWPALFLALLLPTVAVFLPYAALLLVSLTRAWGLGLSWENLSLYWYWWAIFGNSETHTAIVNSLVYSTLGATLCVALGTLVAYIVERRMMPGASLLGAVATVPIIIPGIVLSVGFFAAYTRAPFNLYGTPLLLIAAFAATFLPIAYAHGGSILKGIGPELERAARSLGAGEARTFLAVTLPLMGGGLVSGWFLVFIPIIRELSVAVFLITPKTNVMTTLIYNAKDGGNYEAVCAMSVLLLLITLLLVAIARPLAGLTGARRTSRKTATAAGVPS
ncbi:iron(III) transport system permease protein [Azospirillum agricola]|uniref:ABC transporter permease n=1 Tax=Azospirillum agricola TaxID=1720247 RepID=UPI001AE3DC60|nr:iron ABC transporter permease [Azospirillum agricola]MBP2227829.1 iron(III) transport system permease protein [Azospirillum agricola]